MPAHMQPDVTFDSLLFFAFVCGFSVMCPHFFFPKMWIIDQLQFLQICLFYLSCLNQINVCVCVS